MSERNVKDEADIIFDRGENPPVAEGELMLSGKFMALSLPDKLRTRDAFRTADKDGQWDMIQQFCGPMKGEAEFTRQLLGL